jgi:hypothetical protein
VTTPDDAIHEKAALLAEIGEMLERYFAFDEYGRLAVEVAKDSDGNVLVRDVVVDQLVGSEAAVEKALSSSEMKAFVPVLARAVDTLCLLEGADLALVGGGTFVHASRPDGTPGAAFLPGLIRAPSPSFEQRADEALSAMRARAAELEVTLRLTSNAAAESDMVEGTVGFSVAGTPIARAKQVVIGSFSRPHRSWVWGGDNPSLAPEARRRSKALLDSVPDRAPWEVSTPGFATDEPTAWALAAWVAHLGKLTTIFRVPAGADGFVVLGLSDVEGASGA